jgi:hypothetical protein
VHEAGKKYPQIRVIPPRRHLDIENRLRNCGSVSIGCRASGAGQRNPNVERIRIGFHCTVTGAVLTIFSFQPAAWPSSLKRLVTKRSRSASVPFAVQNRS